ncbi:MAG: acyl-ACP--UDP-N-acetylglucosamine O-acyltransferase [candidate division WOR-3 bacterium]
MNNIHKTCILGENVKLGDNIYIGPYSIIEGNIEIGDGTYIDAHVMIRGNVRIGKGNRIYFGACIGYPPQDVKFKGEDSWVIIGDNNIIREFVTIHRATGEGEKTIIGNSNFFMAYSHIAHNSKIGNGVIIVNGAQLGGHVEVEDFSFISANSLIHQFVRIGKYSIIGGGSHVKKDIVPYALCYGNPDAEIRGINSVGLKRRGISGERLNNIKRAFKILFFSDLNVSQALERLKSEFESNEDILHLIKFIELSKRGITKKSKEDL